MKIEYCRVETMNNNVCTFQLSPGPFDNRENLFRIDLVSLINTSSVRSICIGTSKDTSRSSKSEREQTRMKNYERTWLDECAFANNREYERAQMNIEYVPFLVNMLIKGKSQSVRCWILGDKYHLSNGIYRFDFRVRFLSSRISESSKGKILIHFDRHRII